ncbi:MAG: polyphosphate--glucose phosphotransferase [Mycobacteriales bacterium]
MARATPTGRSAHPGSTSRTAAAGSRRRSAATSTARSSPPRSAASTGATRPLRGFGIDIGGSGIKGAVVDLRTGRLLSERTRIPTPIPSTPAAVGAAVTTVVSEQNWRGKVGATFPAVIDDGVARSAANVDHDWIGTDVDAVFTAALDQQVSVLNDADAAGLAEVRFGAAKDVRGVVLVLTFGTGIGSGMFLDGELVPNTELGHLQVDGKDAEQRAAASVRERKDLSWKKWSKRVTEYLRNLEGLFTPALFVIGGGVSKQADKWQEHLDVRTPIKAAQLHNDAGIVGAALHAREHGSGRQSR